MTGFGRMAYNRRNAPGYQGDIGLMPTNFEIGDVVSLRKAHPCGGREWRVVRVGADIGIVCAGCARRVTLVRSALERRMRGQPRKEAG